MQGPSFKPAYQCASAVLLPCCSWMVHVCTHAHRTHGTAAMLLADPGQRVFPDGVDDQDAAMQCVPYPTKKSLSAIYRTAAAAPPPPPAPVAGASAAGPAGATTAGSSRAPPTASLPVTAPGAAEGTTGGELPQHMCICASGRWTHAHCVHDMCSCMPSGIGCQSGRRFSAVTGQLINE